MNLLPERIRAFIAVPVLEPVRVRIGEFQQHLKRELPDVSWTRPDAMHLTLRFLGNIESACVEQLAAAARAAAADLTAFELSIGELGSFGDRIIWLGIARGAERLCELAAKIREAADPFSAHGEDRVFSPHITLGRCRRPIRGIAAALRKFALPPFKSWTADRIEIIRSELSPKGSTYTTLAIVPLRNSGV
jgi:2'-5' RNA ligase